MIIRDRMLPEGWYPARATEAETLLGAWSRADPTLALDGASAAIAPHAGWYYSGRIAWTAWRSAEEADAVVIIGGHLPAGSAIRYYAEDGFRSPFGVVEADGDLTAFVRSKTGAIADSKADNTVEIHVPMAAHRFPGKPVACFRAPNDGTAARLGEAIAAYAGESRRSVFVLGSTDLTHYGPAYDYEPGGPAPQGFAWARRADDGIVDAFVGMDEAEALNRAELDCSACSVGAAIAAMAYAKRIGATRAAAIMRGSSDELAPDSGSSVGYCSVAYARPA